MFLAGIILPLSEGILSTEILNNLILALSGNVSRIYGDTLEVLPIRR